MSSLVVQRPNDFGGRFRRLKINIDACQIATLKPNEQTVVELTPGLHVVVGAMDWGRSRDLVVEMPVEGTRTVEVSLPFAAVIESFTKPRQAVRIRLIS